MSQIKIEKPKYIDGTLTSRLSVSSELEKYITNHELFVKYENTIYTDESILNIPLTATILPLAWLTGANVKVNSLDKNFKESMDHLQKSFSELYPRGLFKTEIQAKKLVTNNIDPEDHNHRTGLLFSGGVDSMYTLYKSLHLKPKLIMFWGVDDFPYPERNEYWTNVINIYEKATKKLALDLYLVKTNITDILDKRRLSHRFHRELYDGNFRTALQHSMILLPLAAPLSFGRYDHLLIAASGTNYVPTKPRAARPLYDEQIRWADLNVEHHGFISRNTKVREMKGFIENEKMILKVCLRSKMNHDNINDSSCEKCNRTIISLVVAGIDPNLHGFTVDEITFQSMKHFWQNRITNKTSPTWVEIQKLIPENIEHDIHGSKEFLEWFREFNISTTEKSWFYTDLYTMLPYSLALKLLPIYRRMNINPIENPKKRENQRLQ